MEDNRTPIIMGSDHAAYCLKEYLKDLVIQKGIEIRDVGAHSIEAVDYPDFGFQVAGAVSAGDTLAVFCFVEPDWGCPL